MISPQLTQSDWQLIDLAFNEDLGCPHQDITTDILFKDTNKKVHAKIVSKHPTPIVVSGLFIVKDILQKFTDVYEISSDYQDGDVLAPGKMLLHLSANASIVLRTERIILNFLQRLCGIATLTAEFTRLIAHTSTKILDTRKTTPGWRRLEKYAVQCGGGCNHRMGLYDALMIKDNHIDFLGGMMNTLNRLPDDICKRHPVIVEVRSSHELHMVLNHAAHKVTRVLLDNMPLNVLAECTALCRNIMTTEASGTINLHNVVAVAECGVDFISIGKLTHSVKHVDLSMQCSI